MTLIVASATSTAARYTPKQKQPEKKKSFKMISKALEIICCALLVLSITSFCSARPPQGFSDQSTQGMGGGGDIEPSRNLLDASDDLTGLKMQLLAQQLAEYSALQPLGPAPGLPERFVLTKRQQRYRQCYFNPISCFRK